MKHLSILILVLVLASCGSLKHSNFNRKKFTDLKTRTTEEDQTLSESKSYETPSEPGDQILVNREKTVPIVESENASTTEPPAQNEISEVTQNDNKGQADFQDSEKSGADIEEVSYSTEPEINSSATASNSQEKELGKFHLLFQIGLMLFIISILLFAMAAFAASWAMLVFCLAWADITIAAVWVISFVLINKGRAISKVNRDKRFKIEYGLAWFTACIGPLAAIGIIILGVLIVLG